MVNYKLGIGMFLAILIVSTYIKNMSLDNSVNDYLSNKNEDEYVKQFKLPMENFENFEDIKKENIHDVLQNNYLKKENQKSKVYNLNNNNRLNNNSNNSVNLSKKELDKQLDNETKIIDEKMNKNLDYKYDFLTQVKSNDTQGYDVSGCRYDFKNSFQNYTKFGPPLAWCETYDLSKLKKCGTLFYPLNG
tara:strand:- start:97 stop:666 length:570 start_codon:yes stop_codon:yes gene_type:complete